MSKESAKAMSDKQRYYDRLHHLKRISDLEMMDLLDYDSREMLIRSREIVAQKEIMVGYNSVDLNDRNYINELDVYAQSIKGVDSGKDD